MIGHVQQLSMFKAINHSPVSPKGSQCHGTQGRNVLKTNSTIFVPGPDCGALVEILTKIMATKSWNIMDLMMGLININNTH
jgi:hypothetical protein